MKIGIITHYDVHNHGAILQLTGLVKVLVNMGVSAQALRFDKNYDFMGIEMKKKYEISLKSIGFYLKFLISKGIRCTLYNIRKRKELNRYKTDNNLIGPYYSEAKDIDAIVLGSDEVFALHTGPTPIMFGHASPSSYTFSYAASFGPTTYDDIIQKNCLAFVSSGLNSMSGISVRDKNSYDIVLKCAGKQPVRVCDPVILYGYKDEIASLRKPHLPSYLLVYAYDNRMNGPEEVKLIKHYAKLNNLKIVSAGFYHKWCDYNINVDPINLLAYFKNANAIITDTFHGCVMSIITHGQFVAKIRDNGNKLINLLEEYKLTDRISSDLTNLVQKFYDIIDYHKVEQEVANRRTESMQYLSSMILSVNEHNK